MAGQAKVGDGNLMNWTHKHKDCYIKFTCNSHLSRKEGIWRHGRTNHCMVSFTDKLQVQWIQDGIGFG